MSNLTDATDQALAVERAASAAQIEADTETIRILQGQHTNDGQTISELRASMSDVEAQFDAYRASHPDLAPPTPKVALGVSMSRYAGHTGVLWDAARCYNKGDADQAIDVYQARVVCHSPTDVADTPSAVKAECERLVAKAAAKGIQGFEVHYTASNEADRHFTGAQIPAYLDTVRSLAPAVYSVAGCSLWMNLTRYGIKDGRNEAFILPPDVIEGYAINCYSPGMEKTPIEYTPWDPVVDPMVQWVATVAGGKAYSCWETGTRSDDRGLRPAYMAAFPQSVIAACDKYGIECRAICYWDSVTTTTRDTRFETDGTATRDAWRGALS